jgi:hypothetical protein
LGRVDACVSEQSAHFLEVVMLLKALHGNTMAQVMGLQLGAADDPAIELTKPPHVLSCHRR